MKVPAQFPLAGSAKIAFIGEAPSTEEVIYGKPFVGPAGRVFNAMLRQADLDRDDYLVTNAFDEQAPDNDLDAAGWFRDEVRVAENMARLVEELDRVQPNVIVPLGGSALWMFTGDRGIAKFRGSVMKATRLRVGAKLVPTYHPSAIQRDWRLLTLGVTDFVKAAAEADIGAHVVYPKVELLIEPNLADLQAFAVECKASPKLSVDIETGWGQIRSIAFAPTEDRAMSIPFIDLRRPNRNYWPTAHAELEAWKIIRDICEAPNPKLGQNFLYDIAWLWEKKRIAVRNYRYDTRLRHKVMFPELPADLATMGALYTNLGAWKHWSGGYQKDLKKDG